jgi:hypothetical protein
VAAAIIDLIITVSFAIPSPEPFKRAGPGVSTAKIGVQPRHLVRLIGQATASPFAL